ncbi:MAG: hypothetical protein V4772_28075 [Pseudomonadota bacterium]
MVRPLRIEYSAAVYHITSRGDRREPIAKDDIDRAVLFFCSDNYLLEVCPYVDLNPVHANMVERPDAYRWSSYRVLTGPWSVWPTSQTGSIRNRSMSR